jgi:hypothetical protein
MNVGGRGEIRTHGTLAGTPVFKTGALNHSATLPNASKPLQTCRWNWRNGEYPAISAIYRRRAA